MVIVSNQFYEKIQFLKTQQVITSTNMGTSYSSPTEIESKHFTAHIASLPPNGMKGKNVAITGCTSGTGFIAAKVCVQLGALRVMMLNRVRSTKKRA